MLKCLETTSYLLVAVGTRTACPSRWTDEKTGEMCKDKLLKPWRGLEIDSKPEREQSSPQMMTAAASASGAGSEKKRAKRNERFVVVLTSIGRCSGQGLSVCRCCRCHRSLSSSNGRIR
jgi:hypothetical protein